MTTDTLDQRLVGLTVLAVGYAVYMTILISGWARERRDMEYKSEKFGTLIFTIWLGTLVYTCLLGPLFCVLFFGLYSFLQLLFRT